MEGHLTAGLMASIPRLYLQSLVSTCIMVDFDFDEFLISPKFAVILIFHSHPLIDWIGTLLSSLKNFHFYGQGFLSTLYYLLTIWMSFVIYYKGWGVGGTDIFYFHAPWCRSSAAGGGGDGEQADGVSQMDPKELFWVNKMLHPLTSNLTDKLRINVSQ